MGVPPDARGSTLARESATALGAPLDPEAIPISFLGWMDIYHWDAAAQGKSGREMQPAERNPADPVELMDSLVEHRLPGLHFFLHNSGRAHQGARVADQ